MIYEAPQIAIEPVLGDVISQSNGGTTYLPDEDFPE